MKWLWLFGAAAVASAVSWSAADQARLHSGTVLCSMSAFTGFGAPYETILLATPQADTVAAADGQPPFELLDQPPGQDPGFQYGHDLPRFEKEPLVATEGTFGQIVRVSRYGGYASDTLSAVLGSGEREAVLVPWGYDPACQVTPWKDSFVWTQPGEEGLFKAWMRAPDRWVEGRPTFDVRSVTHTPYPHAFWFELGAERIESWLSPEKLFELLDARPVWTATEGLSVSDVSRLQAWRRVNPDLESFYPVGTILRAAYSEAEVQRVLSLASPIAGTYAVRVIHGDRTDSLFIRTSPSPTTVSWADRPTSRAVPDEPWRSTGHYLALSGAADTLEIRTPRDGPSSGECNHRFVMRVSEGHSAVGSSRVWAAEVPPFFLSNCLGGVPELDAWDRALEGRWATGSPPYLGRFVQDSSGAVTFEQEWSSGESAVRVIARRLSSETLDYRVNMYP